MEDNFTKVKKWNPFGDDILYFLHIPKTAGTTLTTIIDRYFDLEKILPDQVWNHLLENFWRDFSKYHLIRGHLGYGVYRILPKKPVYITMLRDPLQRTISQFHHITSHPMANNWLKMTHIMTLPEMLNDYHGELFFTNAQVRELALDIDVISQVRSLRLNESNEFYYHSSNAFLKPEISNEQILAIAKKRLSEFVFFGLTERFEESLLLLSYIFGWNPMKSIWKEMVLPKRPLECEFPQAIIDKVKDITKLDYELYHYAQRLFDFRFTAMIDKLKEKYYQSSMSKMNTLDMAYAMLEMNYFDLHDTEGEKLDFVDYKFDKKLYGDGWYPREYHGSTNEIFRWTGPTNSSSIDFSLKTNEDLKIQFRIISYLTEKTIDSLRLKVNDNDISLTRKNENNFIIFDGVIQKSILLINSKFTRLVFQVEQTFSPNSLYPSTSTDVRPLGVAIDQIIIKPISYLR